MKDRTAYWCVAPSMRVQFADHAGFHRAFLFVILGASLGALALTVAGMPVSLAGVTAGTAGLCVGAATQLAWRSRLLLSVVVGTALVVGFQVVRPAGLPGLVCLAMAAVGVGLAAAMSRARAAVTVLATAGVGLLAAMVSQRIAMASSGVGVAAPVLALGVGSAFGLTAMLALLPRHILISVNPLRVLAQRIPAVAHREARTLCEHAVALHRRNVAALVPADRVLFEQAVTQVLLLARTVPQSIPAEDGPRLAEIEARIAAATDNETRTQYQATRTVILEQLALREGIQIKQARIIAQMHHQIAELERFVLAVVQASAKKTSPLGQLGANPQALAEQRDQFAADLAAARELNDIVS